MSQTETRRAKRQIPTFTSRAEEAEFWDTHHLTDYFDDFEPKPAWFTFESPLSEPVTLHIDIETMEVVRAHAAARDMPPDVLLQIWILERRDAEWQRQAAGAESPTRPTESAPAAASEAALT